MSDTPSTPSATEAAITTAATEMIRQAAERKGWTVDQVPQEAKDYAF